MKCGQMLIELIVAMGMLAIFLPALLTGLVASSSGKVQQDNRRDANLLIKEEFESLNTVRNTNWAAFANNGFYHTVSNGANWTLISGTESGYLSRWAEIADVYRNNGAIVTSGGTLDPSTKKVTVTVSWSSPLAGDVSATRYYTRYQDNLSQTDTTQAQFDLGTKTNVTTTNVSGGEVVLGGGGHGDWCQPSLTQWGFNLNHNASGTAISAVPGRAFVVTGNNNASDTFYDVNISDTYPPIATNNGNLTGQMKAYSVIGDDSYAYIATDTQQKQGTIIQLSTHTQVGWLDIGVNSVNGRAIATDNGSLHAFLGASNNKIYLFGISTKTGTKTPLTSVTLPAIANKIIYSGSNLYAALNSTSNQLAIIPLTNNNSSFGTPSYVSVSGQAGKDVYISGTKAYLATGASATQAELFVINLNTNSVVASQDTSGMDPTGVIAATNNKVIVVGIGGYEYQVYNYNDTTGSFSSCVTGAGFLNIDSGINGIAWTIASGQAYSYIITGDSASEFKIIEGGPNGAIANSGTYTSAAFDTGASKAFNRLSWTADVPSSTTLQFQVAIAAPVSGSCASANFVFVGPDGSSSTYFTSPGAFPLNSGGSGYINPGECFKYKAYLTTSDLSATPTIYDVTWGYSP